MSSAVEDVGDDVDDTGSICEFCGLEITDHDQQCPALDDGRCQP